MSKAGKSLPWFHLEARVGGGEVTMFQAVIIRLLCQMNVSASLQTAAVEPPSIMSYSPQPLVRANKHFIDQLLPFFCTPLLTALPTVTNMMNPSKTRSKEH